MNYHSARDVQADIRRSVPDFAPGNRKPRRLLHLGRLAIGPPPAGKSGGGGDFLLVAKPAGFRHRGIDLSSKVAGLGELALEEGFRMAPNDIAALGLADGDPIELSFGNGTAGVRGTAKADPECPEGVVYFTRPVVFGGLAHRRAMAPLYQLASNPVRAGIAGAGTGPS